MQEQQITLRFKAFIETSSEFNAFLTDIKSIADEAGLNIVGLMLDPVQEVIFDVPDAETAIYLEEMELPIDQQFPDDWTPEYEVLGK